MEQKRTASPNSAAVSNDLANAFTSITVGVPPNQVCYFPRSGLTPYCSLPRSGFLKYCDAGCLCPRRARRPAATTPSQDRSPRYDSRRDNRIAEDRRDM